MYFKKYYHSHIKAKYKWQDQIELTEYNALSKEDKKNCQAVSCSIAVCQKVGMEFWQSETLVFWEEVVKVAKEQHEQELKEWKDNLQAPKSPDDFHQ